MYLNDFENAKKQWVGFQSRAVNGATLTFEFEYLNNYTALFVMRRSSNTQIEVIMYDLQNGQSIDRSDIKKTKKYSVNLQNANQMQSLESVLLSILVSFGKICYQKDV